MEKSTTPEYRAFVDKYRPRKLSSVVGQDVAVGVIRGMIASKRVSPALLISGPYGCVDAETEFLTPVGWKRISDYQPGDLVGQFHIKTGYVNFTYPASYIKDACDKMYHFHTKYGVDQMLSEEHKVLYTTKKLVGRKDHTKWKTSSAKDVVKSHRKSRYAWNGLFGTTFKVDTCSKLLMSDVELRIQVAVIADGSFADNRQAVCINIKKKRKIDRLTSLLKESDVEYRARPQKNGYTRFYFIPPMRAKSFDERFWAASERQLSIISDECLLWDGDQESVFNTRDKKSADFIQYAFTVGGKRARLVSQRRRDDRDDLRVIVSEGTYIGFGSKTDKANITIVKPDDGFKYCFTVPSGFLVLRRKGCIFVTGNCGKTTLARIIARYVNCQNKKGADECEGCDSCDAFKSGNHPDIHEIDAGSMRGIDNVRDLKRVSGFSPRFSKRIYILDEVQGLSSDAFRAALKLLEEPPKNTIFILSTNEPQKLPPTIQDRCMAFELKEPPMVVIAKYVRKISKKEGFDFDREACEKIAKASGGHIRSAVRLLEQTILFAKSHGGKIDTSNLPSIIQSVLGLPTEQMVVNYVRAVLKGDVYKSIGVISYLHEKGLSASYFLEKVVTSIRCHIFLIISPKMLNPRDYKIVKELESEVKLWGTKNLSLILGEYLSAYERVKQYVLPEREVLDYVTLRAIAARPKKKDE